MARPPDRPSGPPSRSPRKASRSTPADRSARTARTDGPAGAAVSSQPALSRAPVAPSTPGASGERIAKALARAGIASRRDAEKLIAEGRITVNGHQLTTPATLVGPQDRIALDGRTVGLPEAVRLWRYHKPAGLVTTHRDPAGRPTVFSHLPGDLPRVISVGRLDLNTEGLLLLTNDGSLARTLELPATGLLRRYRVRAFGRADVEALARLQQGITVDGVAYGPVDAVLERADTANAWLTVSLREGRNREVRTVLEAVGLKVNRLIRVSYGPFQLGNLPAGAVEEVPGSALPEMLGRLMPQAPVRGARRPEAQPARGPRPAAPVPGQPRAATVPAAPGRPARSKPGTAAAPAGDGAPARRPQAGRGRRRMDPFEEEAAIEAALASRKAGSGGRTGRGQRSGGSAPPGGPRGRPHSSTTPRRPKP